VVLPLWVPILVQAWPEFSENVLGYNGVTLREWGLPQFLTWWDAPAEWTDWLVGPGRLVVLLVSALLPAVLVWWRPAALGPAAGLSLGLFLLLTPAFGMQYVIWGVAAAFLMSTAAGTIYNTAASCYIVTVYNNWNRVGAGADAPVPPWLWYEGVAVEARPQDLQLMMITWCALALAVLLGLVATFLIGRYRPQPSAPEPPSPAPPPEPWPTGRRRHPIAT